MAKNVKSRKRRRGGVKKAAQKVKYITRRAASSARRAFAVGRSWNVSKKDIVISVAGAGAGAVAAPIVAELAKSYKIPGGALVSNAAIAALGGFLAYKGLKKKNMIITGAGMGMAASSGALLINSFMKKDATTSSTTAAPFARIAYRPAPVAVAGPFANTAALAGPFTTDVEEI